MSVFGFFHALATCRGGGGGGGRKLFRAQLKRTRFDPSEEGIVSYN